MLNGFTNSSSNTADSAVTDPSHRVVGGQLLGLPIGLCFWLVDEALVLRLFFESMVLLLYGITHIAQMKDTTWAEQDVSCARNIRKLVQATRMVMMVAANRLITSAAHDMLAAAWRVLVDCVLLTLDRNNELPVPTRLVVDAWTLALAFLLVTCGADVDVVVVEVVKVQDAQTAVSAVLGLALAALVNSCAGVSHCQRNSPEYQQSLTTLYIP